MTANSPNPTPQASRFGDGAISGAAIMIAAKCVGFVITFGAVAIIARLLTPQDYGVVAMVTSVVTFFTVFSDFGLTLVTVQRPAIDDDQISALFWANLCVGILLGTITAALSPAMVWFFEDSRLVAVNLAVALYFPLAALGAQQQALLKRHMRFRRLALVRLIGGGTGPAAAVVLAWLGYNYWALVGQILVTASVTSIAAWLATGWRPGWPRPCPEFKNMLSFGGALTGHGMVGFLANNLDNILLGKFAGPAQLGMYNICYNQLMMRPISLAGYGVGETAIPAMSRAKSPADMRETFRRMFALTCLLGLPVCVAGAWWADDIVLAMLGAQWSAAIPILRVLFVGAAARMLLTATGWTYVATGRAGRMLRWQLIWTPLVAAAFVLGVQWGAIGVAAAYAAALWIALVPGFLYCFHGTEFRLRDAYKPAFWPLVCTLAATAIAVDLQDLLRPDAVAGPMRLAWRMVLAVPVYALLAGMTVPLVQDCVRQALARLQLARLTGRGQAEATSYTPLRGSAAAGVTAAASAQPMIPAEPRNLVGRAPMAVGAAVIATEARCLSMNKPAAAPSGVGARPAGNARLT